MGVSHMSAVTRLAVFASVHIGIITMVNEHNAEIKMHSKDIRNPRTDTNARVMGRYDEQGGVRLNNCTKFHIDLNQ